MRALLVDDEKEFADVLAERLQSRGLSVRTAYDPGQALELVQAEDFDVAVLDVNLPGMNGLDLLTRIKEIRPLIEAVMLTGSSDVRTAVEGMRRGAFNYLVKPAQFDALLAEMRQAREKRIRQEERARLLEAAKLASLGRLAEGVAHEINNPVNVVAAEAGWLEDLLEEDDLACHPRLDELRRVASEIRRQSRRIGDITKKLLFFGKGLDPRPRPVDVAALLAETAERLRERADEVGARLELLVEPGLPPLLASPTELKQVFLHLAENGLDAVEAAAGPERRVTIEAGREPDAEGAGSLVLRFADTGVGLSAEAMAHLFEPFFSTKQVGDGMGLGLSVAYGVVTSLGGEISVDSVPGRTAFSIRLPIRPAGTAASPLPG